MNARVLNEVDRHLAETRAHIKRQREIIQTLKRDGHEQDLPQAQDLLKTLEQSLTVLLENRLAVLGRLRPPRGPSNPRSPAHRRRPYP